MLSQTANPGSAATAADAAERKQRKRLQNRLNQRARRVRLSEGNGSRNPKHQQRSYQTNRWRLDEVESAASNSVVRYPRAGHKDDAVISTRNENTSSSLLPISKHKLCTLDIEVYGHKLQTLLIATTSPRSEFLLHLVNYNAYRGFFTNKRMVAQLAKHFIPGPGYNTPLDIMKTFPAQTITISSDPKLPPCLIPTPLQRIVAHATWIDLVPFPKMRDNLILRHSRFSHWEFMSDVVGDFIYKWMFPERSTDSEIQNSSPWRLEDSLDDEMTAVRTGLILWGEPFQPEAWEATPGFLRKWAWVVEGCDELVRHTNHWRTLRGEEAIQSNEANTQKI
ncbi:hypothetical protein BGZ63DRAFT_516026 [Mariannaea sp. PMI_226]|nr:hypothetical protein BGZ63DRAFT_516026 [Mariannaea sp. PMI_226]